MDEENISSVGVDLVVHTISIHCNVYKRLALALRFLFLFFLPCIGYMTSRFGVLRTRHHEKSLAASNAEELTLYYTLIHEFHYASMLGKMYLVIS